VLCWCKSRRIALAALIENTSARIQPDRRSRRVIQRSDDEFGMTMRPRPRRYRCAAA
jgi:hypothetical protein